jgi:MFS family permease
MFLHRIVAFPESRRILRLHLAAQLFLAVEAGVFTMIPVLLRKRFGASEWETMLATAAQAFMALLAIFWNDLYRRFPARRYLLLLWFVATLPLAGVSLCSTAGPVLAFVLIAAMGHGGLQPLNGDLLRSCYAPGARGRVWSLLKVIEQIMIMTAAFGVGSWLDHNRNAYRWFFPLTVLLIGIGMLLIGRITQHRLYQERRLLEHQTEPWHPLHAYRGMGRVLKEDVDFRRYETAFCIYGLGWMITYAMLPFLVVDVLHLTFAQAAVATQVAQQATLLAMLIPAAHLMDKLGPVRLCAWCFSFLLVYPVLLMTARSVNALIVASVLYSIGMAGVNLAWTLGPISLARDAAQASQYLSIHATLTSVRAILGQLPAVAIYRYTREPLGPSRAILLPLLLAAIAFVIGAVLMWRLERDRRGRIATPVEPEPAPIAVTAGAET